MGFLKDRSRNRLSKELEDGWMTLLVGHEALPAELGRVIPDIGMRLTQAARTMIDSHGTQETVQLILQSLIDEPTPAATNWNQIVGLVLADLDPSTYGSSLKTAGEPGFSGVFSRVVDPASATGPETFGRFHPVVNAEGDVILEDDEEILWRQTIAGVSELVVQKKGASGVVWSYLEPVSVAATNRRLYFRSTRVPGRSRIEEERLAANGNVLVGHFRFQWLLLLERATDQASGRPYLSLNGVDARDFGRRMALGLLVGDKRAETEVLAALQPQIRAELIRRRGIAPESDRGKLQEELTRLDRLEELAFFTMGTGVCPIGYLSRAEAQDPDTVAAVKKRQPPSADLPLRHIQAE